MSWLDYVDANTSKILTLLGEHAWLALAPVAVALVLALPLGYAANRSPKIYPAMIGLSSILYTIPSLALFVILPGVIGTQILDPLNVAVALTIYSLALLVRTVVDGLRSVPAPVAQAATAVGYRRFRQALQVELPVALPVILSGVRVATVSNISLVSVGAVIGVGGLGELFTEGIQRNGYVTPIVVGIVLSVLLAVVADSLIVLVQRMLTPWVRAGKAR